MPTPGSIPLLLDHLRICILLYKYKASLMERITLIAHQHSEEKEVQLRQLRQKTNVYYKCYQCNDKGKELLLYRLIGSAAPFIPLLQLFHLFALPTHNTVTRQLILFIIRSWQAYQQYKCSKDTFRQEFYSSNAQVLLQNTTRNKQIDVIINSVTSKSPEQLLAYAAAVKNEVKYEGILLEKGLAGCRKRQEQSLSKIVVIPHQQKVRKLKQLGKVYVQKGTANVFIETKRQAGNKPKQIMNLEEMLFGGAGSMTIVASEQQIESFYIDLCSKIYALQQQSKQLADFELDMRIILLEVTCICSKQHRYAMLESSCEIDNMWPFLQAVGLQFQPVTLAQLLLNHTPKPPLLRCSSSAFNQILQQQYHIDSQQLPQVNQALTFILIVDCLFSKILNNYKPSLVQRMASKKEIIECLLSSHPQHLHPHARTLINLLKSKQSNNFLASLSLKSICDLFKEQLEQESAYEQKKYWNIKHSLQLKVRLIMQGQNLKYFWQRSKLIVSFKAMGRLICIYMMAKYVLLETEAQFLQLWQWEKPSRLLEPKYEVVDHISKLSQLCQRIEEKMQKMRGTKKAEQEELAQQIALFDQLRQYNFFNDKQNSAAFQLKERTKAALAVMFAKAKEDVKKGCEPTSYFSARKNACLFKILMNLTLENYCLLFCEYQSLATPQPKLKTMEQMEGHFDHLQQKMQAPALQATDYFKDD